MEFLQGWGCVYESQESGEKYDWLNIWFLGGTRNCTFFCVTYFFFFKCVFASSPPGLSQEGRATANRRRRRLVRPPSLYRVPPAASSLGPCSCPSAAVAAQEGKSEEPAQKAAGQTPTSGRNKRRQRRARLRSFPVTRLSPPLQPLSPDSAACEAPGSPLLQSHFGTIVGVTTFFPLHT